MDSKLTFMKYFIILINCLLLFSCVIVKTSESKNNDSCDIYPFDYSISNFKEILPSCFKYKLCTLSYEMDIVNMDIIYCDTVVFSVQAVTFLDTIERVILKKGMLNSSVGLLQIGEKITNLKLLNLSPKIQLDTYGFYYSLTPYVSFEVDSVFFNNTISVDNYLDSVWENSIDKYINDNAVIQKYTIQKGQDIFNENNWKWSPTLFQEK